MKWLLQTTKLDQSGIYQIKNIVNDKIYVGRAVCLRRRYTKHINDIKNHRHRNKYLQREYHKFGPEAFEFSVLEYVEKQLLIEKEQSYLNTLEQNRKKTYNLTFLANGPGNCLNEESRQKISKTLMGHKHSPETLQKLKEKSIYVNKKATLKSPDGNIYHVDGIRNFAIKHGLNRLQLGWLINGKRTSYNGWVCIHKDS